MKKYLSYFQMRFNTMLQYRASAIAGVCTQFFWGLMQILIYIAFYKSATSNNISLEQLVSYVWLRQAFFSLLNHITDPEIRTCVESGNISYELTKPLDLYWMWYSKTVSSRLSTALLKCLPILLITVFLRSALNASHLIVNTSSGLFGFGRSFFITSDASCPKA